jgi:hypothetical protein
MNRRARPALAAVVLTAALSLDGARAAPVERPGAAALDVRSDRLPPFPLVDGEQERQVTGFVLRLETFDDNGGKGRLTIEEDRLTFNDFGDGERTGGKEPMTYAVQLRKRDLGVACKLFAVVFADGRLADRLVFGRSPAGNVHRLLVMPAQGGRAPERIVEMRGSKIVPDALGDGPQPGRFHFETLVCEPERRPGPGEPVTRLRRVALYGSLNGTANLDLDPNFLMLSPDGHVQGSTLMGWEPIRLTFRPLGADPAKKGRRAFELVTPQRKGRSYVLILSPTELGPHRLLVKEGGQARDLLALHDIERGFHQMIEAQLKQVPAAEREAVGQLRKLCGYRVRLFVAEGHVSSVMLLDGDLARLDKALEGLPHLKELSFTDAKLPAAGLACLKGMRGLAALSFYNCDVDDDGLASVKGCTTLKHLIFFGSRGPTARGLAHFAALENVELFQMRREDEPKDLPALDDGLKHLTGMKKLKSLNLHGQRVGDAGLAHLGALKGLEELYLSGDHLTAAGLKHLEGLQELRRVWLDHSRIPDEAWRAFTAKLPKLEKGP